MDLRIRLARPDETPLVHALMHEAFAEYRRFDHPSSALGETVEDVTRALASGGAILAERDGVPVGSGRFAVRGALPLLAEDLARAAGGGRADLGGGALSYARLAVPPRERGHGVGGAMITWLEALAGRLGLARVEVCARSQQPDNRPYYLARGYRVVGYSEAYGIPDLRTHLEKDL